MDKFKVGDAVVPANGDPYRLFDHWRDFWAKGRSVPTRFCITSIEGEAIRYSDTRGGDGPQVSTDDLKPAPLFAVGDKVRHMQLTETGEGTVENIYGGDTFGVRWSSWHGFCAEPASALEPVAVAASNDNALRLETGLYYRTRDGRKVGPMERGEDVDYPWFDGFATYTEAGRWLGESEDDNDLIAEWPAAHDNASTAGFTVPLEAYGGELEEEVDKPDATLTTKITVDFSEFDAELDRIFARLRKLRRKSKKLGIKVNSSGLQDAA